MILCDELQTMLGLDEVVFYGVPQRRALEPIHKHRRFKLNGLWFQAFIAENRIQRVETVSAADVGQVHLPRPAIVRPTFGADGKVIFDDAIVEHRHFSFGYDRTFNKVLWNSTPLDSGKPWLKPGASESMAVSEYIGEVQERQAEVEERYVETMRAAREALAEVERVTNLDDPLWGSW